MSDIINNPVLVSAIQDLHEVLSLRPIYLR